MAINLTTIFGSYISVSPAPRRTQRFFRGYVGAHGMTSIWLGTRGYPLIITGRLYQSGANYAAARAAFLTNFDANIEPILWAAKDTYTFDSDTYNNVIFESIEFIPRDGKVFHWTAAGQVAVDFICRARSLI